MLKQLRYRHRRRRPRREPEAPFLSERMANQADEFIQAVRGRFLLLAWPSRLQVLGYLTAVTIQPAENKAALRLHITAIAKSALRWRTWLDR